MELSHPPPEQNTFQVFLLSPKEVIDQSVLASLGYTYHILLASDIHRSMGRESGTPISTAAHEQR